MKKKLLAALLSVGALLGLASCVEEHVHAFSEDWSKDANGHWHACTCDERLKDSFAPHVDENNDGACDVCAQAVEKKHEHTFATTWSKDETGHWYDSTCDHKVTSGFAAHTAGEDGVCTACGYVVTPPSNVATLKSFDLVTEDVKAYYNIGEKLSTEGLVVYETYSNTLTDDTVSVGDLSKYTITVTDPNGKVVEDAFNVFGVHTVTVKNGELTADFDVTVGAKVYTSVADALAAGIENDSKVNSGNIIIDNDGYVQDIDFVYGKNYTFVSNNGDEEHYQLLEDGTVFGVNCYEDYEGNFQVTYISEPGEEKMLGANLSSIFGYEYEVYGVYEMLSQLVDLSKSDTASNYKESLSDLCPNCFAYHGYEFSFDVVFGEYAPTSYNFEVAFQLDADTNAISVMNMVISGTNYVYDDATETYVPNPEATGPDFVKTVLINQSTGERNAENKYNAETLRFTSFDLVNEEDAKVADKSTFNIKVGETIYLYLANVTPETANPNVDTINVVVTTEDGEETWSAAGSYNTEEGYLKLYSYKPGTYVATVLTTNVTYTFTLNVTYADLTTFSPAIYNSMYELEAVEEVTIEAESELSLDILVNDGACADFTVSLPEGTTGATVENLWESWYFTATTPGVYVLTFSSLYDEEVTATLTVTVEAKPETTEYVATTVIETPWGETEAEFILSLKSNGKGSYMFPDYEGNFEYVVEGSSIVFSNVENTWGAPIILTAIKMGDEIYASVKDAETEEVIFGQLTFGLPPVELQTGDNKVVGAYNGADYTFTNFAYEPTTYVITITNGVILDENYEPLTTVTITLEFYEAYSFTVYADEDGNEVTINIATSTGSGDDETGGDEGNGELVVGENTVSCDWMGADFTFTATEAGTYTFLASPADAYFMNGNSPIGSLEATLEAGESYTFTVCDNNNDGSVVVLISKA